MGVAHTSKSDDPNSLSRQSSGVGSDEEGAFVGGRGSFKDEPAENFKAFADSKPKKKGSAFRGRSMVLLVGLALMVVLVVLLPVLL